jgi:PAS domain S-box-containing protein
MMPLLEQHFESQYKKLSQQVALLEQIDLELVNVANIESLIRISVAALQTALNCEYIILQIWGYFYGEAWQGTFTKRPSALTITKQEYPSPTVAQHIKATTIEVIDDLRQTHRPAHFHQWQVEIGSALHAQFALGGKGIGYIDLGDTSLAYFTAEHQEFIRAVITRICIAVRYFWLSEEVREHDNELENALLGYIQAEEELQKQEISYRNIVEDQTELICRYDAAFTLTFVNHAYANFYGKQPAELIGTNLLERIPPDERSRAIQHVRNLTAQNPIATSEHQTLMPDGTLRWHQWRDRALLDEADNIIEYQGVGRDITAQVLLSQEQQRHARDIETMQIFLQATIDALPANTAVLDASGTILSVNAGWKKFAHHHGLNRPDNLVGVNYLEVCDQAVGTDSEGAAEAATGIRSVISGQLEQFYFEYHFQLGDTIHWYGMNVTPFDELLPRRVVISHNDVGQRKAAELALQHANDTLESRVLERTAALQQITDRVEAILDNSSDAILLLSPDLTIQRTNFAFNQIFACVADDFLGKPILQLLDADSISAFMALVVPEAHPTGEVRAKRKDGTIFDAEVSIGIIAGNHLDEKGLVCTIRDISERKARERLLHYYASLQATVTDAVISTDLTYNIQSWNPAAERIYGWTADEVLGKNSSALFRTKFMSDVSHEWVTKQFLERGFWTDEVIQHHKDGHEIYILGSIMLFKDETGSRSALWPSTMTLLNGNAPNKNFSPKRNRNGSIRTISKHSTRLA